LDPTLLTESGMKWVLFIVLDNQNTRTF
jgi:hypothetical protein